MAKAINYHTETKCPWCGGEPEIIHTTAGEDGVYMYARCKKCHAYNPAGKVFVPWGTIESTGIYEKIAKAWDTRV